MGKTIEECFPLDFTNISVSDGPLLKDYYWEWLNVGRLNRHFIRTKNIYNSSFQIVMPVMPIHSMPWKVVLFIKNASADIVNWKIKRIKLCDCVIQSVPMGINTFRKGYLCPHRTLLTLSPNEGTAQSDEIFEIQMYFSYNFLGQTPLAFELTITEFDPLTCILTRYLFPLNIGNMNRIIQPIWVFNHYNQDMEFKFSTDEPGLEIVTKNLLVKKYCLTALLVKYKPQVVGDTKLKISMNFLGIQNEIILFATGLLFDIPYPVALSPKIDVTTAENPFILFENAVGVQLNITENSSTMIAVHNFSDKCAYFKWRSYNIEGLFDISVAPNDFICKPNHSQLCVVSVNAKNAPCIFLRVPIACEVYKTTQGGRAENIELAFDESDFDLNTKSNLLKRLWLNVNFRIENVVNIQIPPGLKSTEDITKFSCILPRNFDRTLLDQIFWNQIFGIDFLSLVMNKKSEGVSYDELFEVKFVDEPFVDRKITLRVLRMIAADAIQEIAKRWKFIPIEVAYP